ncbi:MAG: hypothetical protein IJ086_15170 [Clostridium sp.]|nr:hypothetical protein [Clostridium sp.]
MDKEKKKSIFIYIGLIICFIFFSIFVFSKKDSNIVGSTTDKATQNNTVNNIVDNAVDNIVNKNENKSSTKISDEENIKIESEKVVEEFLNLYHKISTLEHQKEFEKAKNLVKEELYKELEMEIIGNSSMPTNGYVYRTIERIDFTDFSFDYSNKEVYIRAKVTSNWLDENKSIIDENEQTVYDFLVSSNNDEWKIGNIGSKVY